MRSAQTKFKKNCCLFKAHLSLKSVPWQDLTLFKSLYKYHIKVSMRMMMLVKGQMRKLMFESSHSPQLTGTSPRHIVNNLWPPRLRLRHAHTPSRRQRKCVGEVGLLGDTHQCCFSLYLFLSVNNIDERPIMLKQNIPSSFIEGKSTI